METKLNLEKFTQYTKSIKYAVSSYQKLVALKNNSIGTVALGLSILAYSSGVHSVFAAAPMAAIIAFNYKPNFEALKFHFEQKKQEKIFQNVIALAQKGDGDKVQNFIDSFSTWNLKRMPQTEAGKKPGNKKLNDYVVLLEWLKDNRINNMHELQVMLSKEFSKTAKLTRI